MSKVPLTKLQNRVRARDVLGRFDSYPLPPIHRILTVAMVCGFFYLFQTIHNQTRSFLSICFPFSFPSSNIGLLPNLKFFVSFLGISPYIDDVIGNIPKEDIKRNGKLERQPKWRTIKYG